MMWGTLPIAAQQVLVSLDAQTLVWARFWVAGIGLFFVLGFAKKLPKLTICNAKHFGLMLFGTLGLSGNFFLVIERITLYFAHNNSSFMAIFAFLDDFLKRCFV